MSKMFFNKSGFTLAEVLVTLTIIGVVAALTIPVIFRDTDDAGSAEHLKKIYNSFLAVQDILAVKGNTMDAIFAGPAGTYTPMHIFGDKMNVTKYCDGTQGCFPNVDYKKFDGTPSGYYPDQDTTSGKAVLVNGASVLIRDWDGDCSFDAGDGPLDYSCAHLDVDINGAKGPNQIGRDFFAFYITRTGVVPQGGNNDAHINDCNASGYGYGCTSKVLNEGKINY